MRLMGVLMSFRRIALAGAMLPLILVSQVGMSLAADQDPPPVKANAKPVADVPFFFVNDNRFSYAFEPKGTDPGAFSLRPNGTFDGTTAKQVVNFTHFDVWAYGTNFITMSVLKSDSNDPVAPCSNAGVLLSGTTANCAGAVEFYGLLRSTFGWNELFNTRAFAMGPLSNISFEVGADDETENSLFAPQKHDLVAGLQFAFELPYKGYFNVAPLFYKEWNHNAFNQCGLFGPGTPGVTCTSTGNVDYKGTWAVETNWFMDLGFLPENMRYFSISGRAGWYGPKGDQNAPLVGTGVGINSTATKTEFNSEPIRLTFDASKAIWGPKYSHYLDFWVAYRYWQNKFGLDHNAAPGICTVNGVSTNSCTESSVYTGVTVKF
jgi:hypothetical protein